MTSAREIQALADALATTEQKTRQMLFDRVLAVLAVHAPTLPESTKIAIATDVGMTGTQRGQG